MYTLEATGIDAHGKEADESLRIRVGTVSNTERPPVAVLAESNVRIAGLIETTLLGTAIAMVWMKQDAETVDCVKETATLSGASDLATGAAANHYAGCKWHRRHATKFSMTRSLRHLLGRPHRTRVAPTPHPIGDPRILYTG